MRKFIPSGYRFFDDEHFDLGLYAYGIFHDGWYSNDCERVIEQQLLTWYRYEFTEREATRFMKAKEDIMNSVRLAHKYQQVIALQANVRRRQAHMRLIRAYFGHA